MLALGVVASGCALVTPAPPPPLPSTLGITTSPGLYPYFSPSETDYISRCNSSTPLVVSIAAPDGTAVSVAGQPWGAGVFSVTVPRAAGQDVVIAVLAPSQPEAVYYVRCLPSDFPTWGVAKSGQTQSDGYVSVPLSTGPGHCTIFDNNGVPLWWGPSNPSLFCTMLPDGNMGWIVNGKLEEHALDGSLVRTISPVPTGNADNPDAGLADGHDLLVLPNGDYVLVTGTTRTGVDLSTIGGPASTSVSDPVIEELTPSGGLVWSWDTLDHVPVAEMNQQWFGQYITGGSAPYDVYHWNSIDFTGSGFVVSYRHLDAVFDIDQTSGSILWKLGGAAPRTTSADGTTTTSSTTITAADGGFTTADIGSTITDSLGNIPAGTTITAVTDPTTATLSQAATATSAADVFTANAEGLTVESDPVFSGGSHFGGQHDARLLGDGTVSLYDDGTNLGRAPRVVRYQLDTTARTATLLESVTDPIVSSSPCCGSARKLPAGGWAIGWGGTDTATETASDNTTRAFLLEFSSGTLIYRWVPVPAGQLNRAALRAGMDAQYANSTAAHAEAPAPKHWVPNF